MTVHVPEQLRGALEAGRPVVALESTVISHGLPFPHNLDLARAMEDEVRDQRAHPATIGVVAGVPTVGMSDAEIERFAAGQRHAEALAARYRLRGGACGATAPRPSRRRWRWRRWRACRSSPPAASAASTAAPRETWDISADLTELARTPVLVVCAGAKVDPRPAGHDRVSRNGWRAGAWAGHQRVPGLLQRQQRPADLRARRERRRGRRRSGARTARSAAAAACCWQCRRPPRSHCRATRSKRRSSARWRRPRAAGVRGQAVTPFLLAAVAEETHGESMRTNIALLRQNARVAAQVARAIAGQWYRTHKT